MNKKSDVLLEIWGAERSKGACSASIPSQLGRLIDEQGVLHFGESKSKCLMLVNMYTEFSRLAAKVDRALLLMFEQPEQGGVGAGRAASLYRLARVRYVVTPKLSITEQYRILAVSKNTYWNWLSALHEYLGDTLSRDVDFKRVWNDLDRLSDKKTA